MKQTKKLSRKVISYILALVMVFSTMTGIAPGMSLTAQAAPTETLLTTITPTGIDTYSESMEGVVNVTLSSIRRYYDNGMGWCYGGTVTVTQKEGYTITKCRFEARAGYVDDTEAPFSIDVGEVTFVSKVEVYGYKTSTKTAQTVTPPTADTSLTYKKDQAQALLTSGAVVKEGNKTEGSIQYRVGADGTWSTEIPKKTNAGTYNVYYRVLEDDTYAEYAPANPIPVTIAKADPETPEAFSAIYGQQAKDITLPTGWSWANPDIKFESSGGVELKANFAGNDNYNPKNNVSIFGTVAKAAAKISYDFTVVHKEYGSTSFTNEITNTGDVTPTYISSATSVATVDANGLVTIKGIGETTITANVAEDNDHYTYETRKASYKLIVNPISTEISTAPTATDITYGQKLSESTLSGGVVNVDGSEERVAGTFAWKEPDLVPNASDSGEYEVEFTPANTNYAKSTCQVTIKVNKKTVSATELEDAQKPVAKTGDDTVYTGEPIELVTAPTADLPLDYEAFYSTDDGDSWSKDIPKKADPGTYTVKVKYVSKGGNCNDIILDNITATITPADKTALTDAIATAKEYYGTIKGNTDYSEAADKLDKAIEAAEEVAAKNKLTKSEVNTAAEAVTKAKATAETEVKDIDDTKAAEAVIDKINELKPVENIKPEDRTKIEAAREAYKNLSDDQKTKLTGLDSTAVSTLEAAEKALDTAEKAAFDAEKEAEKKAADALAADGDSDASKKLIEDAKKAIDELAYDETKSLDENKAALAAIVSKLKSDLTDNRAAEKKEADDTEAAKKVTDAINALPASDKVATTDKDAIEAARKAYDDLTEDQKKKVPADVLKKLEDAEKALAAAEKKEADDTDAAKKVTDAVNALPASDKVATTDKAAIEAARKAYDALTADQKAKVSAETLKKLEEAEKALAAAEKKAADDAKKSEGKNEWIDGQWYGADGNTEYKAKGSWKQNDKGWWYEDTDGWYPKSQWQKIDGLWYYFGVSGYMAASEWIDGWWCDADGACRYEYQASWKQDSTGWWYGDASGWYAVSSWQKIDNIWYYFGADGYMVTNQYVDGYWVNADGAWAE